MPPGPPGPRGPPPGPPRPPPSRPPSGPPRPPPCCGGALASVFGPMPKVLLARRVRGNWAGVVPKLIGMRGLVDPGCVLKLPKLGATGLAAPAEDRDGRAVEIAAPLMALP